MPFVFTAFTRHFFLRFRRIATLFFAQFVSSNEQVQCGVIQIIIADAPINSSGTSMFVGGSWLRALWIKMALE